MEIMRLKVCAVFALLTSLAVVSVNSICAEEPAFTEVPDASSTPYTLNKLSCRPSGQLKQIHIAQAKFLMAQKPLPTEGNIVEGEVIERVADRRRGFVGVFQRIGRGTKQAARWLKKIKNRIDRKIVKPIRNKVIDPPERIVQRVGEKVIYATLWPIKETGLMSEEDRRNLSEEAGTIAVIVVNHKVVKSPLGEKIQQLDERFQQTDRALAVIEEVGEEWIIKSFEIPSTEQLLDKTVKGIGGEIEEAFVQEVQDHEKFRKVEEFLERVQQKIEDLPQREGYQRVRRGLSKIGDTREWLKDPETKSQRGRERWVKKANDKVREKCDELREKLRERLGRPDVQKYRKRIEEINEIFERIDKALRLLKDKKYRREQAYLELERQLALLSEKWNVRINIAFLPIREAEMGADKEPTSTDCLTPVPDEATHHVGDFSEFWYMLDGAKVGPAREWYDKEKTKLKLLYCHDTKGRFHGYTIKYYYDSGLKENKYSWKHGKKDGVHSTWYEQPYKPRSIKTFKDDKLDGISATWAEDGRSLSYNIYENNQLTKRTRFDSKGKHRIEEIWSNGKLVSSRKIEAGKE